MVTVWQSVPCLYFLYVLLWTFSIQLMYINTLIIREFNPEAQVMLVHPSHTCKLTEVSPKYFLHATDWSLSWKGASICENCYWKKEEHFKINLPAVLIMLQWYEGLNMIGLFVKLVIPYERLVSLWVFQVSW